MKWSKLIEKAVRISLSIAMILSIVSTSRNCPVANAQTTLQNMALNKPAYSSTSYESDSDGWHCSYIDDGNINTGWTTTPEVDNNPAKQGWVMIDLLSDCMVSKVVLYPRNSAGLEGYYFPVDYSIQVSTDGVQFTTVKESTNNVQVGTAPQTIEFPAIKARYVKMLCTKQTNNGSGDYRVQLMEMQVYGAPLAEINLNKEALSMNEGETEQLNAQEIGVQNTQDTFRWTSSSPEVAKVKNGLVTAERKGTAVITVTDEQNHLTQTCSVIVTVPQNQFLISAFWPPVSGYINATQYDYLKNAGINYLHNVDCSNVADRKAALSLAAKRGMKIGVSDSRFSDSLNKTDDQIGKVIDEYRNVPGVGGYYIVDEPYNANSYARVYKTMLNHDKDAIPYLNFLPGYVYPSITAYQDQMTDFAQLVGCNNTKYLMYDGYPFGASENSFSTYMYQNMDAVRQTGLKTNVKTSTFIQSVGIPGSLRRTNKNEIRFEVSCALAYGFKQISYFTWWTPTHRSETFTDAIISADGTPTDLYNPVCAINKQVTVLGPLLMKLDALEVYHSGTQSEGTVSLPKDYFFQVKSSDDVLISYMRDRKNGRNYIMAVNKSFTDSKNISFATSKDIESIWEVNKDTAKKSKIAKSDDGFTLSFKPGEARLFEMPDSFDHGVGQTVKSDNLALNKPITATASTGSDEWYINKLNDGVRFSQTNSNGWQVKSSDMVNGSCSFTVDLQKPNKVNRVDLYPANGDSTSGMFFPKDFSIQVSQDGKNWTTEASYKDYAVTAQQTPSIRFKETEARYVRVEVTGMKKIFNMEKAEISEVEVYDDNGNIALPQTPPSISTEGKDLALKEPVETSSSFEAPTAGWSSSYLVDGQKGAGAATNGWTSNVRQHTTSPYAEEWAEVFLGETYSLNKIVVYPRPTADNGGTGFPEDYKIEVSEDGQNWTTVKTVVGDIDQTAVARTITFNATKAAYVKVVGTKLSLAGSKSDGYMMQIGEIEAYGDAVQN